ncbi:leukocyte elastase inhibitor-like isoform X2 [Takifugu flavidus]|uniref:leukocyte elastase inhibitor-like isoform X2 n=1 Tax=Takifugu flavidus TaxID=433684 RepID=UPI0025444B6C|nr:leukocyte elastase inhibitor-like isoform X2 [Takifugu flavidus]
MAAPSPLCKANTSFSLALFRKLSDNDTTANIFYSPFSISSALAMVLLGARGNTAAQMSEVLYFTEAEMPKDAEQQQQQQQQQQMRLPDFLKSLKTKGLEDDVHVSFSQLLNELHKENAPYALSVANRLYGEQSYQFVEDFLGSTKKHYRAELESVDFRAAAETSRSNINSWVEKQTEGKIKDLLGSDDVTGDTRLVLVNAIYFKGNWNKQFKENATRDATFHISKNSTKPVKMMHQTSKFPFTFIPEANCQVLELPYVGKELSMLIFLPKQMEDSTTGLEKLEKLLTYDNFMEWTRPDMMKEVEVQVGLPRFKMEEKCNMKNILVSMGMVDAFDVAASDFSGMSPANDLVLSEVVHKAFVEVNEEGTEAAAATGAVFTVLCAVFPQNFYADHPFLFFIRHNPSRNILFAGRYCSPE